MSETRKIRVGITHGDINGIGYEVILKSLEDNRILELDRKSTRLNSSHSL